MDASSLTNPPRWTKWGRYPSVAEGRVSWRKRLLDLTFVLVAAPVWLPLLAATAVLVRCRLGSPVLFSQQRPGLGGRIFALRKFRTMTDARDASGQLLPDSER